MATRKKSIRDLFEQLQRVESGVDAPEGSLKRIRQEALFHKAMQLANRYKNNIHNAIDRDGGKHLSREERRDIKYDKEVYTRATKAGATT